MTPEGLTPASLLAVLAILLPASFLAGCWNGQQYQVASETSRVVQLDEPEVPPSEYDKRLIELDTLAIEHAYQGVVDHAFEIWMRDATGQPQRAVNGVRKAQRAYIDSMRAIEKRKQKLQTQ